MLAPFSVSPVQQEGSPVCSFSGKQAASEHCSNQAGFLISSVRQNGLAAWGCFAYMDTEARKAQNGSSYFPPFSNCKITKHYFGRGCKWIVQVS